MLRSQRVAHRDLLTGPLQVRPVPVAGTGFSGRDAAPSDPSGACPLREPSAGYPTGESVAGLHDKLFKTLRVQYRVDRTLFYFC